MILSIISQKGGVGKTTTAVTLAAGLAHKKKKVLLVDLDGQCNLSMATGALTTGKAIIDVLEGRCEAQDAIIEAGLYKTIAGHSNMVLWRPDKTDMLKLALTPLVGLFDYIILDTPPQLGEIVINALAASSAAIITLQADFFSLQSLMQLKDTVDAVKSTSNPDLNILGLLINRYSARANLNQAIVAHITEAATQLGTTPYKTPIRESVIIREAIGQQQSIFDYAPRAAQTQDYEAFIKDTLKRIKQHG